MLVMYIAIMKTTYIPALWIVNVIQYEAKYLWRNYRRRSEFKHSLVTGRSTLSEGRLVIRTPVFIPFRTRRSKFSWVTAEHVGEVGSEQNGSFNRSARI